MTLAAPAHPSALRAKGPVARVLGSLRGRIIISVLPIATAAGVLVFWEAIVRGLKISPVILPSPSQVYQKVMTVLPLFVSNSIQTGGEAVLGLLFAAAVGIALGSALAYSKYFRAAIYPNMVFFQLIPKVALAPLFVIWLGIGIESRLTFTIFITFFPDRHFDGSRLGIGRPHLCTLLSRPIPTREEISWYKVASGWIWSSQ